MGLCSLLRARDTTLRSSPSSSIRHNTACSIRTSTTTPLHCYITTTPLHCYITTTPSHHLSTVTSQQHPYITTTPSHHNNTITSPQHRHITTTRHTTTTPLHNHNTVTSQQDHYITTTPSHHNTITSPQHRHNTRTPSHHLNIVTSPQHHYIPTTSSQQHQHCCPASSPCCLPGWLCKLCCGPPADRWRYSHLSTQASWRRRRGHFNTTITLVSLEDRKRRLQHYHHPGPGAELQSTAP